MFPRHMLVPARMWQQPRGHPSTGRQMPGKARTPEGRCSKPRGPPPPSRVWTFFSCRAPLLRVAIWPQLTVLNDVFDDVLAP